MNPEYSRTIATDRARRFQAEADAYRTRRQLRHHQPRRRLRRNAS